MLRAPAGIFAKQDLNDRDRLLPHHHWRKQARNNDLDDNTKDQAANASAIGGDVTKAIKPRSFGTIRIPMVPMNTNAARYGSSVGHRGKSENPGAKYSGRMKCACNEISTPKKQEAEPHRRGYVRADAGQKMQSADPMQSFRGQDTDMLKIALTPTPITDRVVVERRR